MKASSDCDNLIVDGNNLCYINFFVNKGESDDIVLGLTFMYTLNMLKNMYRKFNPRNLVIAFDTTSWRRGYTQHKDLCVTHKIYKATRRQNLEPSVRRKMELLEAELPYLAEIFKKHTTALVLRSNLLEGDDLIAGYVQAHSNENNVIISTDKDFMQLLKGNTRLFNPVTDKYRQLDEYDDDHHYFLFEKCIRGDIGDNVMSSYPRLRKTKIKEAYKDEFTRNNIMNHEFEVEDLVNGQLVKHKYLTQDVFEENITLMSLYHQPPEIRDMIDKALIEAEATRGHFGLFEFLKFCGKFNMQKTIEFVDQYTQFLSIRVAEAEAA